MIKTCDEDYWRFMQKSMPPEAPCGRTFDDVDHSTICPHEPLPPKLAYADLKALAAEHDIELPRGM